jgi:hypothetical protein
MGLNQFLKSFGFPLLEAESNFKELKLFDIQEKVQNQSILLTNVILTHYVWFSHSCAWFSHVLIEQLLQYKHKLKLQESTLCAAIQQAKVLIQHVFKIYSFDMIDIFSS